MLVFSAAEVQSCAARNAAPSSRRLVCWAGKSVVRELVLSTLSEAAPFREGLRESE